MRMNPVVGIFIQILVHAEEMPLRPIRDAISLDMVRLYEPTSLRSRREVRKTNVTDISLLSRGHTEDKASPIGMHEIAKILLGTNMKSISLLWLPRTYSLP